MMDDRELLANPPVTLRRVMDYLANDQDLDLSCDLESEFGLVDLMLDGQEDDYLRELTDYLVLLLAHPSVTEQDLEGLLERCRGWSFEPTARQSLAKLRSRAQDFLDGKVYRPMRPG